MIDEENNKKNKFENEKSEDFKEEEEQGGIRERKGTREI